MNKKQFNQTVTIKTDTENPEPMELVAKSIIEISDAIQRMTKTRLSKRAILLLIHDNCGTVGGKFNKKKPTIKQIEEILDSAASLKQTYIKSLPSK